MNALKLILPMALCVLAPGGNEDWRERLSRAVESQSAGNLTQARNEFEDAVASARKTDGDSAALGTTLDHLAAFYDDVGDFSRAELTLNKSLAVWRKVLGSDNIALSRVIQRLAMIYIEKGELAKAEGLDLARWIIRVRLAAPQSAELLSLLNAFASLASVSHRFDEALDLHRQILELIGVRGSGDAAVAVELNDSGVLHLRQGNAGEAVSDLKRSLELWKNSNAPRDDVTLAMISQNLVEALTQAQRYTEAQNVLESTLPVALRVYGADTPRMAGLLLVQARLLRAEKRTSEARSVDKQVKALMARYAHSDPSRNLVDISALMRH